ICRRGEDVGSARLLRQPPQRHVRPAEGVAGTGTEAAARREHVNVGRGARTTRVTRELYDYGASWRACRALALVRAVRQIRPCPTDGLPRHGGRRAPHVLRT